MNGTRREHDALGEMEVPAEAYWGIHTERARRTFDLAGRRVDLALIHALALVKQAACQANAELGLLDAPRAKALEQACQEVAAGQWDLQFPLDALQGGAGTSTNMNLNEVLANRALELLGRPKGDYGFLHPIEQVNLHQSTNDAYPTALRLASLRLLAELSATIAGLQGALQRREQDLAQLVKMGRTELMAAVPMTLGAEFGAFAEALARDRWRVFKCEERLRVVNLGGTAVGTGLGAPRDYIFLATERLRGLTGLNLCRAENLVDATANQDALVEVAGILKAHACNLAKVAQDLRLLAAWGEIELPALQAGSSIMPGKVNPVALEAVIQASLAAQAQADTLAQAVQRSSLQICEFMPLVADCLLSMLQGLGRADRLLQAQVEGLRADAEAMQAGLEAAPTLVTALLPQMGYEAAGRLAAEFAASGRKDVRVFLQERLGAEAVAASLSPAALTRLGYAQ
jgi:aspartate ammonia-lyase